MNRINRIIAAIVAPAYLYFAGHFALAGMGFTSPPDTSTAMAFAFIGLLVAGINAIARAAGFDEYASPDPEPKNG